MSEPHILYQTEGNIAILTINRPETKNAFSPEMLTLWRQSIEEAKADQNVRVIIVTGKGDTFCSGGDIREMAEGRLRPWDMKKFLWEGIHRIIFALEDLRRRAALASSSGKRPCPAIKPTGAPNAATG